MNLDKLLTELHRPHASLVEILRQWVYTFEAPVLIAELFRLQRGVCLHICAPCMLDTFY